MMPTSRKDNQSYSEIVNEGLAKDFKNGKTANKTSRSFVNAPTTPKPDYIINQMSIDSRIQIEWGFPNSPNSDGKYDASHGLPKKSGGSGSWCKQKLTNKALLNINTKFEN